MLQHVLSSELYTVNAFNFAAIKLSVLKGLKFSLFFKFAFFLIILTCNNADDVYIM